MNSLRSVDRSKKCLRPFRIAEGPAEPAAEARVRDLPTGDRDASEPPVETYSARALWVVLAESRAPFASPRRLAQGGH